MYRSFNTDKLEFHLIPEPQKELLDLNRQHQKPNGLWYGINREWTVWCKREMPYRFGKYDVEIEFPLDEILVIDTKEKALKYFEEYFENPFRGNPLFSERLFQGYGHYSLDSIKLANDYKGIEFRSFKRIANALWNDCYKTHDYNKQPYWWTALDCSSGCLMDSSIITKIKVHKIKV